MRIRPILQFLLSSVALPAVAGDYNVCFTATDSLSCIIEQGDFAHQRNVEINASMARVAATRAFDAARHAEIAASMAAAEKQRIRRLEIQQNALIEASVIAANAERDRRFASAQNVLATASVERVDAERRRRLAQLQSPCTSPDDARSRCEAQRAREFAAHQNALASATAARVVAERERNFAAARNAEVAASIAAVERNRAQHAEFARIETSTISSGNRPATLTAAEYSALTSHCAHNPDSPRCDAERIREFAAARNAEINASIAVVQQARAARAAEYAALTSHCAHNPDSPRCEAERIREFAAARNAEINASIAAVAVARASDQQNGFHGHPASRCATLPASPVCGGESQPEVVLDHCHPVAYSNSGCDFQPQRNANDTDRAITAVAAARASGQLESDILSNGHEAPAMDASPLETGAISLPQQPTTSPMHFDRESQLRLNNISTDPCQTSTKHLDALTFSRGAVIETSMEPELDRLASLAQSCPGMRIEVHGYADGGSHFNNRNLSQERAEAVTDYLIAAGVSPNRVSAIGRGGNRPVLPYSKGYDPAFGGRAELIVRDPSTDAAARRVMWDLAELLDPTYIPAVANLSP